MRPAFADIRVAAAFAALLLVLLLAPYVAGRAGVFDRSTAYEVLPVRAGPTRHIRRELFEEADRLDMVFIGSSLMWSGIDAPYLQDALSAALGRAATVRVIASVWPGLDRDYALLRDLLERREVGLVVIQFPNRDRPTRDPAAVVNRVSDQPHVQAYRFMREGEFDDVYGRLAVRHRVALYAESVLGLPRHLLSLVRGNELAPSPVEATLGTRFQPLGFYGEPFSEFAPPVPAFGPDEMIFSRAAASRYQFFDEPLPDYQRVFAAAIGDLLAQHAVPAVVLHIPQANEIDAQFVEERVVWTEAAGIDAEMAGIPPALLFAGLAQDEVLQLFSSDHLNRNGARFFTRAVAPALLDIFVGNEEID